jgi:hypothetical protein
LKKAATHKKRSTDGQILDLIDKRHDAKQICEKCGFTRITSSYIQVPIQRLSADAKRDVPYFVILRSALGHSHRTVSGGGRLRERSNKRRCVPYAFSRHLGFKRNRGNGGGSERLDRRRHQREKGLLRAEGVGRARRSLCTGQRHPVPGRANHATVCITFGQDHILDHTQIG